MSPDLVAAPRELYRAMDDDADGSPKCGGGDSQLGARVPEDIIPDDGGNVHPLSGGMSTFADHPRHLPPHFRPRSLPGGRGELPVFTIREDQLGPDLKTRFKKKHALVEPSAIMRIDEYQANLSNTRMAWRRIDDAA